MSSFTQEVIYARKDKQEDLLFGSDKHDCFLSMLTLIMEEMLQQTVDDNELFSELFSIPFSFFFYSTCMKDQRHWLEMIVISMSVWHPRVSFLSLVSFLELLVSFTVNEEYTMILIHL